MGTSVLPVLGSPARSSAQGGAPRAAPPASDVDAKLSRLAALLLSRGSVLVAYSGGVDSSLLAAVAHATLGRRALAVIAVSPTLAASELDEARATARAIGVAYEEVAHDEFANPAWVRNDGERCFHCKQDLTLRLAPLAKERGYAAVAYGVVTDDLADHRPGVRATLEEGAWHPLVEAGMSKADVREAARRLGLPVAEKPAAPCLSSRIAYGEPITRAKLGRVEAAEAALRTMGFREFRVRSHGDVARVEVPRSELAAAVERAGGIVDALKGAGFAYVTLDLAGFRSGSGNEALRLP